MTAENEIYDRLRALERETYVISESVKELRSERIVPRIIVLEEVSRQMREDVSSIEKLSKEMTEEVKSQKAILKGFLMAASTIFALMQMWPVIKELLKGALT